MDFDFSNYTYSGLITIFSMIMGLAYPAVQSAIHEIDAKYDSAQLVEFFVAEKPYRWFRFWLALSIAFALCCPFVLTCCKAAWVHYTWMFAHTIVVLALLASSIKLYSTIMTYYRPGQLVEYLKTRAERENVNVASLWADVANFAALKGQKKVYMAAEQAIADQLAAELRAKGYDIQPARYDVDNPSTFNSTLSEEMNRAIERMVGILKNRRYETFFTADTTIVSLFYNIIEQHSLSGGLRDMIWRMVSEVTLSNNKEWVMNYWGLAEQYARSLMHNRMPATEKEQEQLQKEQMMMKEFHAAMGGMFIKYGKAKWLRDILFFTNMLPADYPLLSNSLVEVVDMLERFEKHRRYPNPWYMQQHYLMKGLQGGVNTDADIIRYVELFIGLEFLRLWHIDKCLGSGEPLAPIPIATDVDSNQRILDLLERLKWGVNEVFDKNLNATLNFRQPTKSKVMDVIDKNVQAFTDKLQDIIDNPEIDEDKRKAIIECIEKEVSVWKIPVADAVHVPYTNVEHFTRLMPHKFPKEYLLKHYNMSRSKLGKDAVDGLKMCFDSVLPSFLLMQQPVATYRIAYEHVVDALRRLVLNDEYVILALGFRASSYFGISEKKFPEANCKDKVWTFSGARIDEMWGRGESSLIIMRRNEKPVAELVKNEKEKESDLIADSKPIYSNLKSIDGTTIMNVSYRIYVDVHYAADMKFVRINIPNVSSDNRYDLEKVQKIGILIK